MEDISQSESLALSRRGLLKGGLAVSLGVAGLTAASSAIVPGVAHATNISASAQTDHAGDSITIPFTAQTNWRYCIQCRNIFYAPENGPCAWNNKVNHQYVSTGSTYQVVDQNPDYSPYSTLSESLIQGTWTWCRACSCLFYGAEGATSYCAAPGQVAGHNPTKSGEYYVLNGTWISETPPLQPGWRYCYNCKDMYWGGEWATSVCWYQVGNATKNKNNGNNGTGHAPGNTSYCLFIT